MMSLDIATIRETTREVRKAKNVKVEEVKLTEKENEAVKGYVKAIEEYIPKWALDGKDRFLYDCSKLSPHVFAELALKFKEANPYFYVESHFGLQRLAVDWSGKHEV